MKLISRLCGYVVYLIGILIALALCFDVLSLLSYRFGFLGVLIGLFTIPISVPLGCLYEGIYGNWTDFVGVVVVLPVLNALGRGLVKWSKTTEVEDITPAKNPLGDFNNQLKKELATPPEGENAIDYEDGAKWFRKAADMGDAKAQRNLGWCYENGRGVEKDSAEAAKWYRKAAEQGYTEAQFNLGSCYYNGTGVEKDLAETAKWYRKAAEQRDAKAQLQVGLLFLLGSGVIKNEVEGLAWLYLSSANGYEPAATLIASDEKKEIYNDSTILAARQRATELQAQIFQKHEI